jgi:hypothetical protein
VERGQGGGGEGAGGGWRVRGVCCTPQAALLLLVLGLTRHELVKLLCKNQKASEAPLDYPLRGAQANLKDKAAAKSNRVNT